MDGGSAVQGTVGLSDKKSCILCSCTEIESLCKECYVPWMPLWTQTLINLPPDLLRNTKLYSHGQFVCLQCVSMEEYGLSVRHQLSQEQKRKLDWIEFRAELQGGFPGPEIIEVATITLPQRTGDTDINAEL
jgi:hypothetical protein